MKSALPMPSVEATSPPTLTWLVAPNNTPLGLRIKTWPLALRLPSSVLGLSPVMRFRAMAWVLGCLNTSASPALVDSLSQSIATRWLLWLMVVVRPAEPVVVATLPMPALTEASAALAA